MRAIVGGTWPEVVSLIGRIQPRTQSGVKPFTSLEGAHEHDANTQRNSEVGGWSQEWPGPLQRADRSERTVQLLVPLREWRGLESRGAARRGGSGVLQHGAERRPREKRNAGDERGDEGRMHDRKSR